MAGVGVDSKASVARCCCTCGYDPPVSVTSKSCGRGPESKRGPRRQLQGWLEGMVALLVWCAPRRVNSLGVASYPHASCWCAMCNSSPVLPTRPQALPGSVQQRTSFLSTPSTFPVHTIGLPLLLYKYRHHRLHTAVVSTWSNRIFTAAVTMNSCSDGLILLEGKLVGRSSFRCCVVLFSSCSPTHH